MSKEKLEILIRCNNFYETVINYHSLTNYLFQYFLILLIYYTHTNLYND